MKQISVPGDRVRRLPGGSRGIVQLPGGSRVVELPGGSRGAVQLPGGSRVVELPGGSCDLHR